MKDTIKDLDGWRGTIWGMQEMEILSRFESEITRLPKRRILNDNQYVDIEIQGYELNGYDYDVSFVMDEDTQGLVRVSLGAYYDLEEDEDDSPDTEEDGEGDLSDAEEDPIYQSKEDAEVKYEFGCRFKTLDKLLCEKYGKPSSSEDFDNADSFKDLEDLASISPELVKLSLELLQSKERRWVFPTTIIVLKMFMVTYSKRVTLDYSPARLEDHSKI